MNNLYLLPEKYFFNVKRIIVFISSFLILNDVLAQVTNQKICPGGTTIISTTNLSGTNYQWQLNKGSGFSNLSDNANYSGSDIPSMQIINAPSSWYGYLYRCVVDGIAVDTFKLQMVNTWTGNIDPEWEITGNWGCNVLPDAGTDVIIQEGGFTIISSSAAVCRSMDADVNSSVRINTGGKLAIKH